MASSKLLCLCIALAHAAAARSQAQSCVEPGSAAQVTVVNGEFENQADTSAIDSACPATGKWNGCIKGAARLQAPAGWQATGYTYVAKNGNPNFGRVAGANGKTHVVIQAFTNAVANRDPPSSGVSSISQKVTGMKANGKYTLAFLAAERPGLGDFEALDVVVNGKTLLSKHNPATFFQQVRVAFNADSNGAAVIKIVNTSPQVKAGDHSVMVDDVVVYMVRDCGKGATCHDSSHYVYGNGYECRCDAQGFVGHTVRNGKAVDCEDISKGTPVDANTKMVAQLKEDMKEMGVTVGKVVLKQAALVVEVNTLQREKDALVETVAKMGSDHVAAIKAAKDDLQKQIDALTKAVAEANHAAKIQTIDDTVTSIVDKRATMQTKLANGALKLAAPASEPVGPKMAPQIVSDGEVLDVQLRAGSRLTVNGNDILTADETVAIINNLLQAIAGEL